MTTPALTPARARELAAAADNLAQQLEQAHAALRADVDEHRRRAGFRLEDAAGQCRRVADELQATASDLARLAAIRADACRLPFRVCPEPVTHTVTDADGTVREVCDGHAIDVRARLIGGTVTPLTPRSN